jgi:hypothetical protein
MAAERKEGALHRHRELEQVGIDNSSRVSRILEKEGFIQSETEIEIRNTFTTLKSF